MPVILPSDRLIDIQQLDHALLLREPVKIHHIVTFLDKNTFVPMATPNFASCAMSFRVVC